MKGVPDELLEAAEIDGCGELMFAMERFVGGPNRVIAKGFYNDVYEKLQKLDPQDKEGWIRHFTMPFVDHDGKQRKCNHSDALEIVEEATWYRKENKVYAGEKFIEEQMKLPRKQTQGLLMAKFALYAPGDMNRPWQSDKRDEMVKLLKRIAEADENTFWGTSALGWLACKAIGEPAFSTYWGWRKGDIPTGKFETTLKYGVGHSFSKPGEYTVTLTVQNQSSAKAVRTLLVRVPNVIAPGILDGLDSSAEGYVLPVGTAIEPFAAADFLSNEAVETRSAAIKSITGLPSGLSYKNGQITGTPKKAGLSVITVTATYADGTDAKGKDVIKTVTATAFFRVQP